MALRAAGVRAPIVLLEGVFSAEQLAEAAHHGFELVVHDPLQLKLLEAHRGAERFVIWIKIDTGMNRLGFRPEAFPAALARLRALTVPALELRVMTHLARADERSSRDDARAGRAASKRRSRPRTSPAPSALADQHRQFGRHPRLAAGARRLGAARARAVWRFAVSAARPRTSIGLQARDDARNHGAHGARGEARRNRGICRCLACRARQHHCDSRRGIRRWPAAAPCERHARADRRRAPSNSSGACRWT